jgi:hypothetical protein
VSIFDFQNGKVINDKRNSITENRRDRYGCAAVSSNESKELIPLITDAPTIFG